MKQPDRRQLLAWLASAAFTSVAATGLTPARAKGKGGSAGGNSGSGGVGRAASDPEGSTDPGVAPDLLPEAVKRGEALPLRILLPRIERTYGGEIIAATLQRAGRRLIYTLRMLSPGGRVFLIAVDAATGHLFRGRGFGS